jgi:hypothetical protein
VHSFIVGWDIMKNGQCNGHRDLLLYFKVFWWSVCLLCIRASLSGLLLIVLPFRCAAPSPQVPRHRVRSDRARHRLRWMRRLLCDRVGIATTATAASGRGSVSSGESACSHFPSHEPNNISEISSIFQSQLQVSSSSRAIELFAASAHASRS